MSEQDLHDAIVEEAIKVVNCLKDYGVRMPALERLVRLTEEIEK